MIRLTVNAQSDPEIHLFNKSTILLGTESAHVDLPLLGSDIQPIHLKIIEQDGFPILINYANDPFVSVNGHPFGKKLLNSGDIIVVHQITILFENLNDHTHTSTTSNRPLNEETQGSLLEDKMRKQASALQTDPSFSLESLSFPSFTLPFEQDVEVLREEELKQVEKYLKDLESPPSELPKEPSSSSSKEKTVGEQKKIASLKDDYLRDLDDDNPYRENSFAIAAEPSHLYQAWKWILLFIFSLLTISGAIGTIIYFSMSDKSEAQETKAAQGVADIAMALTHAQLNRLKPNNQNWSDVDFLKSNLQTVLPDTPSYATHIDAHGQFNSFPYSLRIYTSSDLSHFLLIAQPAPSLLYWLIPQSIIVVDSHLLELRTLKDVRNLNRLLANSDPLEGSNGKEIMTLVKQGGLIRLSSLANDSGHLDFSPPKNLAWIRPGAENFIYNAPRYYRLGQTLLQKATTLSTSKGSSQEVANLKQDVENFGWLNHLILYSDQGKKSALLARQGLLIFAPSDKFLFGYLLFNAQGKIHQVHLLKDDEEWKEASLPSTMKEKDGSEIVLQTPDEGFAGELNKKNLENPEIDRNHPLYIQLQSLMAARENELKPLGSALVALVTQELQGPRPQFQIEYQDLSHAYLMADAKHRQALKENLDVLFHQYDDIPIDHFLAFLKELNLEQLISSEDRSLSIVDVNVQQNMESLFTQIENSKSLAELDHLVHIAITWLNFDNIKDPQELMKYQNLLRNHVLEQLERYLLSSKKHYAAKREDKDILQDILNHERLIKIEERDFFLQEFNELSNAQQKQMDETVEIADDNEN